MNETPLHRLEIEAMDIAAELIDHLLEASENVHARADDHRRVSIASARQVSAHFWRLPLEGFRVEAKQNITNL